MKKITIIFIVFLLICTSFLNIYNHEISQGAENEYSTLISFNDNINCDQAYELAFSIDTDIFDVSLGKSDFLQVTNKKSVTEKDSSYLKIERSLLEHISNSDLSRKSNDFSLLDLEFVDDLIRIEVTLICIEALDFLKDFSDRMVVENHYNNLAQVLIPMDLVKSLSAEDYVKHIRTPVKPLSFGIISEGVSVIGADKVQNSVVI